VLREIEGKNCLQVFPYRIHGVFAVVTADMDLFLVGLLRNTDRREEQLLRLLYCELKPRPQLHDGPSVCGFGVWDLLSFSAFQQNGTISHDSLCFPGSHVSYSVVENLKNRTETRGWTSSRHFTSLRLHDMNEIAMKVGLRCPRVKLKEIIQLGDS
jgi:hypothetical protein